ncbi:MAG: hypothetical protein ACW986_16765 [Promethearchaeota archaeon]|jgi:type III secretory pathway component EscS
MDNKQQKETVRYMAIVGGIIGLVQAISGFAGPVLWYNFWGLIFVANIISSIIGIILAILVLLSVFRPDNPIPYKAVLLIIFGVLMTLFNAWMGGVILIVGGILWLVWKL